MPERGGYNTRRYCRVHAWDCPHATTGECIDAHPVEWAAEVQAQLEAEAEYWEEQEQVSLLLFLP